MDINEVPQDPKNFKGAEHIKKLLYATDKDGKYTGINSAGWDAENFALKQAWNDVEETLAEILQQVKTGTASPIAYFMQKSLMDIGLLAKYAGKWKWQVKKHLKPEGFAKLDEQMMQKYADIFNITVEELRTFGK